LLSGAVWRCEIDNRDDGTKMKDGGMTWKEVFAEQDRQREANKKK